MKPSEEKFEAFVEKELKNIDYESINKEEYDKKYCLIPKEVILFIKNTQGKKFEALEKIYGIETEKKILLRIASEIEKRGVLDVLKKQIKDRGQYLDLCYFKPNSDLNPDHKELYQKNNFSLVRQLYFSAIRYHNKPGGIRLISFGTLYMYFCTIFLLTTSFKSP